MRRKAVALIDEPRCIGCTLCIEACPVDAIAGARGFLHTVIADYCIGCELCVAPCPVDCIAMVPSPRAWTAADAKEAQKRARARKRRIPVQSPRKSAAERRAILNAILKK
jgi:Na+-translocating ferredoxin:NAD+ oxidoreductase subunit B